MKNINLTFTKPQVKINGETYDVNRSDAGILQDLMNLDAKYVGKDMTEAVNVLDKQREMLAYIETLLGAGAADKIVRSVEGMDGYDLGVAGAQELITAISSAAVESYTEAIAAKYDD